MRRGCASWTRPRRGDRPLARVRSRRQSVNDSEVGGDRVVVGMGHREATAAAGERAQVGRVAEDLGGRHGRDDLDLTPVGGRGALDVAALGVEVAEHVALGRLGHGDDQLADGFEHDRLGLGHRVLEAE
jgi:hypothetical protein